MHWRLPSKWLLLGPARSLLTPVMLLGSRWSVLSLSLSRIGGERQSYWTGFEPSTFFHHPTFNVLALVWWVHESVICPRFFFFYFSCIHRWFFLDSWLFEIKTKQTRPSQRLQNCKLDAGSVVEGLNKRSCSAVPSLIKAAKSPTSTEPP